MNRSVKNSSRETIQFTIRTDNVKLIDLTDADYVLLSEEDVEKEISVGTD
jgi:hypothetical protein